MKPPLELKRIFVGVSFRIRTYPYHYGTGRIHAPLAHRYFSLR